MGFRFLSVLFYIGILLMVVAVGKAEGSISGMDSELKDSSASFVGEHEDDRAGFSVASAGDVNGDGYDDIMMGASHNLSLIHI